MDKRFWDFSLNIYGVPGVAPACLRCQDEAGADVNLILFLLWRAVARYRLAEGEIASLDALVAPWRKHIVEPLRAMRRELKSESLDETGAFRERIKHSPGEVQIEHKPGYSGGGEMGGAFAGMLVLLGVLRWRWGRRA